jgi:transposase
LFSDREAQAMSFELDPNLRKKIEKRRREERDSRIWRRLSAILWLDKGITAEEVAARLGICSRQVRKWLKTFRNQGLDTLCELRYQGRVPQLNDSQRAELKLEIAKGHFCTARQIADWINQRFAVQYAESGVKDLLKRLGVSYHKVTGFLWKADAVAQEEWLDDYRCDPVGRTSRRYFVDACHPVWGFELIYYCWLLVGQRFHVKVGNGRKRLNILGAYCPEDHEYLDIRLTRDNINGEQFVNLLRLLLERHPQTKRFLLYLDNAAYYGKPYVKEWLARHPQFQLKFLPPYSPNLNLIERLWKLLRKEAFCRSYDSFEDMQQGVCAVLDHLERYHRQLDTLMTEDFHILHPQDYPECCAASSV